jgi:lysophospholipase L1-like esterase
MCISPVTTPAMARNMNFPTGMRPADQSDEIHINDKGYQIVANRVVAKLKELKY